MHFPICSRISIVCHEQSTKLRKKRKEISGTQRETAAPMLRNCREYVSKQGFKKGFGKCGRAMAINMSRRIIKIRVIPAAIEHA